MSVLSEEKVDEYDEPRDTHTQYAETLKGTLEPGGCTMLVALGDCLRARRTPEDVRRPHNVSQECCSRRPGVPDLAS